MPKPTTGFSVTLRELRMAYRKAKADLYYASDVSQFRLYEYEESLDKNLTKIRRRLRQGLLPAFDDDSWTLTPKGLSFEAESSNLISSDPWQQWAKVVRQKKKKPEAEFRLIENMSIDCHVVSALWINRVGHHLDASLSEDAYGNRLRRKKDDSINPLSLGSFKHYFGPYRSWRDNGIKAMRSALDEGKKVVSISADVTSFYHELNPDFLLDQTFLDLLDLPESLSAEDRRLTRYMVKLIAKWAKATPLQKGLPVGLSASSVIGNVALLELDRIIQREVVPLYYGRYVDDVILVMENTNGFLDEETVWDWVLARSDQKLFRDEKSEDSNTIIFQPDYLKNGSNIRFENEKNKVFILEGDTGKALVDSLVHEIQERASEWRALPEVPRDAKHVASSLLGAMQADGTQADSLRKAETLSLKRASLAIILRDYEAYERSLPPASWEKQRNAFFQAVVDHLIVPQAFFDLAKYLPRIIQLALASGELDAFQRIIDSLEKLSAAVGRSCSLKIKAANENDSTNPNILAKWRKHLGSQIEESIVVSFSSEAFSKERWKELESEEWKLFEFEDYEEYQEANRWLFERDLARQPFRSIGLPTSFQPDESFENLSTFSTESLNSKKFDPAIIQSAKELCSLLKIPIDGGFPSGFIYPTRPFNLNELYVIHPDPFDKESIEQLSDIILGQRGFTMETDAPFYNEDHNQILVDCGKERSKVRIAIASWKTKLSSWTASVAEEPDPDWQRFHRLNCLLNEVIRTSPPPDFLILPELSIPSRWFFPIAQKLQGKGISFICGIEYQHTKPNLVRNQVWAALPHDSLGFPSLLVYRQDKQNPALHEEDELRNIASKVMQPEKIWEKGKPPVIVHRNFHFSLLVCSELTNIDYRAALRGKIDALFVPEWNQDTETFNALIESAALDVHAYIIQCNDRQYGDSRIRVPHKDAWMRDPVRIKGGKHDYFVVGEIDIIALRQFQSHDRSPNKPFKPLPDGFKLSPSRKTLPKSEIE